SATAECDGGHSRRACGRWWRCSRNTRGGGCGQCARCAPVGDQDLGISSAVAAVLTLARRGSWSNKGRTDRGHAMRKGSPIWIGILIGSTVGGLIPGLWGDDMLSYSSVLLSGVGAFVGLWVGFKMTY